MARYLIHERGVVRWGFLTVCAAVLTVLGVFFIGLLDAQVCPARITIQGNELCVLLAEKGTDIERGLGGRDALRQHDGMLFIFPEDGNYVFWMRDMRFAIDIVWIDSKGTIVGIDYGIRPESYPTTFKPPAPVRMVLEVPAGTASDAWLSASVERLQAE